MKKVTTLFFIIFATLFTHGQNSILDSLKNRSEIVAKVKVLKITETGDMDLGTTTAQVYVEIEQLYKGKPNYATKLDIAVVSHAEKLDKERVVIGKEYIVFLKKINWIIAPDEEKKNTGYTLTDRLLGIQPYFLELQQQLVKN